MHGKDNSLDLPGEGRERSSVSVANDCVSHLPSAAAPRLDYSPKVTKNRTVRWNLRRSWRIRFKPNPIIDRIMEVLFAAEV